MFGGANVSAGDLLPKKDVESGEEANIIPIVVERRPRGTFFSSSINLLNTILGAGMLTMPSAISTVGSIPGVLLILLMGGFSGLGLYLLTSKRQWSFS